MVIKKEVLEKIRTIIDKHHKYLLVAMLGQGNVPRELKEELKRQGLKPEAARSFLETAYHHNWLNDYREVSAPKSHPEMETQQKPELLPNGEANQASVEYLHSNFRNFIEKHSADVKSRIESIIQATNNEFKFGSLQELDRPDHLDQMIREKSKAQLKIALKDYAKDATRNWERIVNTEVSNAISLGSADRIVAMNQEKSPDEIYVYRIVVNDAALCKYCRKFYQDADGTPKLYRLSTILGNGSNYGKKSIDWKPVALATHPNERCSPLLELKPGWKVLPGGSQAFIGHDQWGAYLKSKQVS